MTENGDGNDIWREHQERQSENQRIEEMQLTAEFIVEARQEYSSQFTRAFLWRLGVIFPPLAAIVASAFVGLGALERLSDIGEAPTSIEEKTEAANDLSISTLRWVTGIWVLGLGAAWASSRRFKVANDEYKSLETNYVQRRLAEKGTKPSL